MENLISQYPAVSRAIEIAKVGNYSLSVYADIEKYPGAREDYEYLKEFCKGWFENFLVFGGDLLVEMTKVQNPLAIWTGETKEDISERIEIALNNKKPEIKLSSDSRALLDNAIRRFDISLKRTEIIKQVSATIAQMDGEDTTKTNHFAEAINYSIMFGNNVQLEKSEILLRDFEKWLHKKEFEPYFDLSEESMYAIVCHVLDQYSKII